MTTPINKGSNVRRTVSEPPPSSTPNYFFLQKGTSIRHQVTFTERRFDVGTLPADLQRVYRRLASQFGDEYGLIFAFTVRTAVELHRAWHMTLLTSKILQQIKDRFGMRMTWNLGVIRIIFRVEDGGHELHRKVPYDYDSEYQDMYTKVAVALVEGRITIHEALIFQAEVKLGLHTARSGLFLRDFPGRLVLYPLEASTCTVIFFGGDWKDAGVAAVCGLSTGIVEYALGFMGGDAAMLVDVLVGITTGLIGGLFYRFVVLATDEDSENDTGGGGYCLSAIFLGTLYWFFYGTAFVIGLLEILAGELETGVTRFIAVSVKTFVLTLGSAIGLLVALSHKISSTTTSQQQESVFDVWVGQDGDCNTMGDLSDKWWRIPLYLLCSASALGQYRSPLVNYWRGLTVQLIAYEVQYQMFQVFASRHDRDFLDTAVSNIFGAMAAVLTACTLSYLVDAVGYYYNARLLRRNTGPYSSFGECMYGVTAGYIRLTNWIGIGKQSSLDGWKMQEKLKQSLEELHDPNHPRNEIRLQQEEEVILTEAIVEAENLNIWALLMPAVYQLVPGSMIAKLWYNAIFPPPLVATTMTIEGTDLQYTDVAANPLADDVFYGLWVISTSLAIGLLLGFAVVQIVARFMLLVSSFWKTSRSSSSITGDDDTTELDSSTQRREEEMEHERVERKLYRQQGVMPVVADDDPDGSDPVVHLKKATHNDDTTQPSSPVVVTTSTLAGLEEEDEEENATTPLQLQGVLHSVPNEDPLAAQDNNPVLQMPPPATPMTEEETTGMRTTSVRL